MPDEVPPDSAAGSGYRNATEDGRGVYTALGFRPSTTAMTLTLEIEGRA
jgi:hypothetical protein